ncbi:MAG: hypothetical protein KBS86_03820 [Proteobacteria bacterium]|nr:hypothetical protein [Candidatus Enterousia scatequi]
MWSFVLKGVGKGAVRIFGKKTAKGVTKQIGKKATKRGFGRVIGKVLDYTDPFWWIWQGGKFVVKKIRGKTIVDGASKVAKKSIFRRGIKKIAILGGGTIGFGYVVSNFISAISAPEVWVPMAVSAGIATYATYKVTKKINDKKMTHVIENKNHNNITQLNKKQLKQVAKLTPEQITVIQSGRQYAR